ncbi:hypothetical protein PG985_016207 [Apiospora marii]|uniref:uncharacterized protein n=1 Tax=Apiospora marii TaxID=335849 RepID=UPI0031301D55
MGLHAPSYALRQLAPRQPGTTANEVPLPALPRKRHKAVVEACTACRKKKIKVRPQRMLILSGRFANYKNTQCMAERPTCSACAKSGRTCVFSGDVGKMRLQAQKKRIQILESENQKYETLFRHMQTGDMISTNDLVRRVREGEALESLVRTVNEGALLLGLVGSKLLGPVLEASGLPHPPCPCTPTAHQQNTMAVGVSAL